MKIWLRLASGLLLVDRIWRYDPYTYFGTVRVRVRSSPGDDDAGPDEKTQPVLAANELSGTVKGPAVLARDIQGGVHVTVEAAVAAQPIPAQLPREHGIFAGRDAELESLDNMVANGNTLLVLTGVGGSGKTALATYWARRAGGQYLDGILVGELDGHDLHAAASPESVLSGFLLSLGVQPDQVPSPLAAQRALFRTLTSGRRMLVLLDNAATAAQVRVLLPGPGASVVLVTTRWRLAGLAMDGARFLHLGPLDDGSAARVIDGIAGGDRIGAEPEAVMDLVRLCDGLPLAVRIVGAQLALRPLRPVSRLAAELASEQERLARLVVTGDVSVMSAFDMGYRALSDPAARCYRLLSALLVPDFSAELAAACSDDDASRSLDELVDANLLEEIADERFRLHDLARLHAKQRAQDEAAAELTEATARVIGWYLREAVRADRVLFPSRHRLNPMYTTCEPGHEADALDWLETELPGLVAAVHAAHDSDMHETAWQLCEALVGLFSRRKHFPQWIETSLVGIASTVICENSRAESAMRIRLGLAYLETARAEQAARQFDLALGAAKRSAYLIGQASALEHLGLISLKASEPESATAYFQEALAVYRQLGGRRGVMLMTRRLGEASRDAGHQDEAISALSEARTMAAELEETYHELQSLIALGQAYANAAKVPLALAALNEALRIANNTGSRHAQARVLEALAGLELAAGRRAVVREHLSAALALYTALAAPEAEAVERLLADLQ
jgi:tetratricopeptide (TPR) repeat protein